MSKSENIGRLLGQTRRAYKIPSEILCYGICSESMLKKIEANSISADYLLVNRLFERMGKSINQIALTLSNDDYIEYFYQQSIPCMLAEKNLAKSGELLEEYKKSAADKSALHRQYYYFYMGIYHIICNEHEKSVSDLRHALEMTLPDFSMHSLSRFLLARDEIIIILLWLLERGLCKDKNAISEVRMLCIELEKRHYDIHSWDIIFPQIILIWKQLAADYPQYTDMSELDHYCEKVFSLLSKEFRLYYIPQFLKFKIEITQKVNPSEANRLKKQRKALKNIYDNNNVHYPEDDYEIWYIFKQQNVSIISEFVKNERNYRNLFQHEMAELATLDDKTLSRIETGTSIPKRTTMQKLMDAMDMEHTLYNTEIDVTDFKLLEYIENMRLASSQNNIEEEIRAFKLLKENIPKSRRNMQYIEYLEINLMKKQSLISNEEALSRCKCILEYTRKFDLEKFSKIRLNITELHILAFMAKLHLNQKNYSKARILLESLLKGYDSISVDERFHSGEISLLLSLVASACEEMGDYEEAIAYSKRGILMQLKNGTGYLLAHLQSQLCFAMVGMSDSSEQCVKIYEELYHLLCIWNMKRECHLVQEGCARDFNVDTSNW